MCIFSPVLNGLREPDRDYYNDLPGKVPPDIGPPPVPPLPITTSTLFNSKHNHSNHNHVIVGSSIQNTPLPNPISSSCSKQTQQWSGNV